MLTLQKLLFAAGLLHFAILSAAALVPFVLDWRTELSHVRPFLRQLMWVYGAFITLTIIGFGTLTTAFSGALAGGSPLARGLCGFISLFWAARLGVQLFVFDIRPIIRGRLLRVGYHGLTGVFTYFAVVYAIAAIRPGLIG
jgi:hypothetical protein